MNKLILLVLFLFMQSFCYASLRGDVRAGNTAYTQGLYDQANQKYVSALSKAPANGRVNNNLGLSNYRKNQFPDALSAFNKALGDKELSAKDKSTIAYNMGNTFYKAGKTEEAVNAYKTALDLNPANADAKYNLSFIRQKKKNQQARNEQNDQPKNNKPGKNDQKKDPKDDKGKPDQNRPDQPKKDQPKPSSPSDIQKDEAARILDKLARDEERNPVKPQGELKGDTNVDKDW